MSSAIVLRNPQNGQQLFSIPIQATATAPATANIVTTFPEVIGGFDFGPTVVGTIQQVRWSVTNIGNATSGALDLSSSNDIQFSASAGSCPALGPGDSCDVTVTYAPRADLTTTDPDDGDIGPHSSTFSVTGFPGSAYVFSGSGRPTFSAANP